MMGPRLLLGPMDMDLSADRSDCSSLMRRIPFGNKWIWKQMGPAINGDVASDSFGASVPMSEASGKLTLVVGAPDTQRGDAFRARAGSDWRGLSIRTTQFMKS